MRAPFFLRHSVNLRFTYLHTTQRTRRYHGQSFFCALNLMLLILIGNMKDVPFPAYKNSCSYNSQKLSFGQPGLAENKSENGSLKNIESSGGGLVVVVVVVVIAAAAIGL